MELLAFILVDGLIYGAWLFIVSVGLTLVSIALSVTLLLFICTPMRTHSVVTIV